MYSEMRALSTTSIHITSMIPKSFFSLPHFAWNENVIQFSVANRYIAAISKYKYHVSHDAPKVIKILWLILFYLLCLSAGSHPRTDQPVTHWLVLPQIVKSSFYLCFASNITSCRAKKVSEWVTCLLTRARGIHFCPTLSYNNTTAICV